MFISQKILKTFEIEAFHYSTFRVNIV